MFDDQKYGVFDEFHSVDDLRRHMIDYGHLFFYINDRLYSIEQMYSMSGDGSQCIVYCKICQHRQRRNHKCRQKYKYERDKFLYLFGRIMPSFSLVLSMTIRYVDRFSKRFRELKKYRDNQLKCGKRRYFPRIKNFAGILSAMIFWSLENSIETSDSMKDRGYGLRGRTSFSLYKFTSRDMGPFVYMLISIVIIVWGAMNEKLEYRYYPSFSDDLFGVFMCITYVVFFILCIIPLIIELKFRIKFKNKPEDKNK